MEEQAYKTKTGGNGNHRMVTIVGSVALFVVAIFLVTVLILNNSGKNTIKTATVRITNSGFQPATLSVKKGTQITWVSNDSALHQVASNPFPKDNGLPGLKSEILNQNQNYTYTADTVGTFGYHDQITPTINGTIIVKQ